MKRDDVGELSEIDSKSVYLKNKSLLENLDKTIFTKTDQAKESLLDEKNIKE